MPFPTLPSQVRSTPGQAIFGLFEACFAEFMGRNDADATAEVFTVVVTGSTASTAYTITIVDDVTSETLYTFNHTVGSTDTTTTLHATSIKTGWNADATARSYFAATSSSATLTFTGRHVGLALTISESDANLNTPTNTTNAGSPANILPGRLVIRDNTAAQAQPTVKHPVQADFTAQVITYTYGSVGAADIVQATVYYRGESIQEKALYTASQTATLAALASALNTAIDARWGAGYSIAATSDATTVVFTAEVPGDEFDAISSVVGAGAGTESKAWTAGPSASTSLIRKMKGVAMWHASLKSRESSGDLDDRRPVYKGYDPVRCGQRGVVFVETTQAINPGDAVYVGTDTTNPGKFYNAAAADLIWLPPAMAQWESDEISGNGQGLAKLRINL